MDFVVLGPIEVVGPEGNRVNLTSDAQRRLVGIFVLHANTIVRRELLEDALGLTNGALRTSVSRMRRIVGFDRLVTAPPGYELRTEHIDALRFQRLLAEARVSSPGLARELLDEALSLWRGEPYEEFSHEPWAEAESRRLCELHAGAVEDLAQLEVAAHDWSMAIARLDELIAAEPYRDRPRGLLMAALADAGRRVDALRAFQSYRRQLADEVGTEPSRDLVALDRRIAAGAD